MELLLLALVFVGAGRSSSSAPETLRRGQGTQSKLLDRSVANPVRKPSPYVNNFGTRSKPADAPASAPPALDTETGKPEINWGQAAANCVQAGLPAAGVGLAAGGPAAPVTATVFGLIGCAGGALHEIVNPTGRS